MSIRRPPDTHTLPQSFAENCELPYFGSGKDILVVVDPMVYDPDKGEVPSNGAISRKHLEAMAPFMKAAGISGKSVMFLSACTPVTKEVWDSDKKLGDHIKDEHEKFLRAHALLQPKMVLIMGKAAARQVMNRAVKITKIRGVAFEHHDLGGTIVMPTIGIGMVLRVPEHADLFAADLKTAGSIVSSGYVLSETAPPKMDYRWCLDLSHVLAAVRAGKTTIGLDTEATAYSSDTFPHWYISKTKVLTVQLSIREGETEVVPLWYDYNGSGGVDDHTRKKLIAQLRAILQHDNAYCVGQNLKYDYLLLWKKLNIVIRHYEDDTLLLAHALNENMLSKSLEDIARVYVPEMAGYKDEFLRAKHDMSRMDLVAPDELLRYSGGDSDTVLRLSRVLLEELRKDQKNYNCYRRVVMPAIRAFCKIEPRGFKINTDALNDLYDEVKAIQDVEGPRLLAQIPKVIRDEYANTGVGLKLTRDALLRAYLFTHPKGLKLKPKVFTKSKIPSVSTKLHLPFFVRPTLPFIADYMAYSKNEKMLTTYIGQRYSAEEHGPTGFWKYIVKGYIHPSYLLHGTKTGRSSSKDPNGQNFPKRGTFAKAYRAIFDAPEGWVLLSVDYSQLELRIAGWLANEPTFINLYKSGADIHCATAAVVMGISLDEFMALKDTDPDTFKLQRYRAKAVNFGFLYGMGWRKFVIYAKTDYGIDYTDEEGKRIREAFFSKYTRLAVWHEAVKTFVQKHGYVRSLDGRVRHLPAVVSDDDGVASSAERQGINSPVQGFGSDLGLMAIARIEENADPDCVRVIGFVHDAIVCLAKKGREVEAARFVKEYMQTNPLKEWFGITPPLPIVADVEIGPNLADTLEVKDDWLYDPRAKTYEDLIALSKKLPPPSAIFKVRPPPRKCA